MSNLLWREISEYKEGFLEYLVAEKNSKQNTIESYLCDLSSFANYLTVKRKLSSPFHPSDLVRYVKFLKESSVGNSTICRKLSSVRQFMKFLYSEKLLDEDYSDNLELPKKAKILPKFLTVGEIGQLLNQAKLDRTFSGQRFNLMLHLTYGSGFRVSEVISLKKSAVRFKSQFELDSFLIIYGKGGKERLVPLNNFCLELIQEYLKVLKETIYKASSFLFPSDSKDGYITRQRFGQQLKLLAFDSGLDPEKVSPHILRHSLATHLLSEGADLRVIQEILGHNTIATTEIYTHLVHSEVQKMLLKKHPLNIDEKYS